ncbi:MAG: hypothetical protein EZS28_028810 [Streblomastix strix]|uniref:Uncharacterized protein n=1 Tax=Streblomastix strix TaxID=222440 RepID=A0A5J4UZK3_9EUKA|nr:MAG: hypothetical protein EZS28_028810 [Streblomastix strix]
MVVTGEYASKAEYSIMKLAGIDDSYSVTSIKSASIINIFDYGATMEEITRISRRRDCPKNMQMFYYKNLNNKIGERLGRFQ